VDFCFVGIKSIDGVEILILMIPSPLAKFSPDILDFYRPSAAPWYWQNHKV
jgi:hypothetical protein